MLRRWRAAWPHRSRRFDPPWPQQVAAAPEVPPTLVRRALRLLAVPRRGAFHEPRWVEGPQNVWTAGADGPARRARWLPLARRGAFHEPPWPQVAAPPVWPPSFREQQARRAALARRGRFLAVPPAPAAPAAPGAVPTRWRARLRWLPSRRGAFHEPPWPPLFQPTVYAVGSAVGIGSGRVGNRAGLPRRGAFAEPPWAQVAAQPSVWRPQPTRASLRLAGRPTRRGQFHEPPWPQAAPSAPTWPPSWQRSRRGGSAAARRGRYLWTPPRPAGVPAWLRSRSRPAPSLRRRRFYEPRWVEGPQTVWRPDPVCPAGSRPRWPTHRLRRSRLFEPGWPQAQQFIGTQPRWVEEAGGGGGLAEGGTAGSGLAEGGSGSSGLVEGGTAGSGLAESGASSSGLVEGSGGV